MKKLLHRLTGLVRSLVLFSVGLALLTTTMAGPRCQGQPCWPWVLDYLRPHRNTAMLAGGLVLILELFHILIRPHRRKPLSLLTFKSRGGKVSVKVDAVRAALRTLIGEIEGIEDLVPTISKSGRHVDLDVEVRARAGAQIPKLCSELKDRSRQIIADQVGLFQPRQIRIHIEELVRGIPESAPPAEPSMPESPSNGAAGGEEPAVRGEET